jgi:hypothetical protein
MSLQIKYCFQEFCIEKFFVCKYVILKSVLDTIPQKKTESFELTACIIIMNKHTVTSSEILFSRILYREVLCLWNCYSKKCSRYNSAKKQNHSNWQRILSSRINRISLRVKFCFQEFCIEKFFVCEIVILIKMFSIQFRKKTESPELTACIIIMNKQNVTSSEILLSGILYREVLCLWNCYSKKCSRYNSAKK